MKSKVAKILSVGAILLFVLGCKKNDGKGKLYLNLKSVNGTSFRANEYIRFEFEFSHPTSEIQNDTLFWTRKFFTCPYPNTADTSKPPIKIPEFISTKDLLGTFEYEYQYGNGLLGCDDNNGHARTDSAYYYFWIKDKNGISSDTVKSPKIILKP